MIIIYYLSPCVSSFVAAMNFVPVFLLFSHQLMALTAEQITFDLLNSIEMERDYYFQDRLVERLNSIVQLVDQTIPVNKKFSFFFINNKIFLPISFGIDANREATKPTICQTP